MSGVVATCGHCEGTGTCARGTRDHNCSSCVVHHASKRRGAGDGQLRLVICSVCNGTGKVRL